MELPPFLTDENIPDPVGSLLQEAGYTVFRVRDVAARGTADQIVARIGDELGAIVVTSDRDFRSVRSRLRERDVSLQRLKNLHRIVMRCKAPEIRARLEQLLPVIEFEYEQYQRGSEKRMYLEIGSSFWRSHR